MKGKGSARKRENLLQEMCTAAKDTENKLAWNSRHSQKFKCISEGH
jgi:hypothetical protein